LLDKSGVLFEMLTLVVMELAGIHANTL